ncbi:MAG: DegT/DnrJ/EryC1/StrS family aminotransferase [Chloroflexi bacterium]|nr:DegT/DnrJ/EryC1/StrS family aminotransferase [Chloroflexota bacterium]
MTIKFVDLKAQLHSIKDEIDAAMNEVMSNCSFVGGKAIKTFEEEFAAYCGVKHVLGVGNGTDALQLALLGCGVGPGQEVITATHTFTATAEAIVNVGARPVFVDVDQTYNIDVNQVQDKITSRTRAIIPVHLYGQPADMAPLMSLADKHGLKVIEDAAQAHGARYQGRRAGSLGHVACFSFYPGKNLGAYGDAGAVATGDPEIARRVDVLRDHGRAGKYVHEVVGFNSRLDSLQAAVLRVKLSHLDDWNERRRSRAALYNDLLAGVPGVVTPFVAPNVEHVYHLYVIQVPERDRVQAALKQAGIETGIHYPIPLHEQPAYSNLKHMPDDFPVSHAIAPQILSLPMFAELTDEQIHYVVDAVKEALAVVC